MAGAAVCRYASCSAPFAQGKVENSCGNARWKRSDCACRSTGHKAGGMTMRSCWRGEECRPRFGSRRSSRRGHRKGFRDAQRFQIKAGFEEILHNQVLVSGSAASILGQLAKPISTALRGKGFNWRLIYKSGGMPSTHSATVTAAATALGIERGLSDSLFGLSVILACLVMYDAQGVRRAVGKQAEVINTMVFTHMAGSVPPRSAPKATSIPNPSPYAIGVELARDPVQAELAFMEDADAITYESSKSTAVLSKEISETVNGTPSVPVTIGTQTNGAVTGTQLLVEGAENLPSIQEGEVVPQEIGDSDGWRHIPLKESVGHTKLEVLVGGIFGIGVALALHSTFQ
ncbi:unnamed protein product [Calypogeia fissa]